MRRRHIKNKTFFPEYLRVATPREFILKKEKGGELNGPITSFLRSSLARRADTISGSARADWRFFATYLVDTGERTPTRNPCERPVIRWSTKPESGCDERNDEREEMLIGVDG